MENKEKLVRKIASRVIAKYNLFPPIDVESVIKKRGIIYREENLATNADGYSDLSDTNLKIILNSQMKYEPRKRFTIAHELGHIFIGWHDDVTLCKTDNEYSEHNMLDIQEREANVFASELLMPTNWVKNILEKLGQDRIESVVKVLSQEANTSIMASFYALENAMEEGHAFFVYGNNLFPKHFISGESQGICFWGYSMQETYEYLAFQKEYFSINQYDIAHYILPDCPSNEIIRNIVNGFESATEALHNVFGENYNAWIVWTNRVVKALSNIYVGFLHNEDKVQRCYNTDNSEMVWENREKARLVEYCTVFDYEYEVIEVSEQWSFIFIKEPVYILPKGIRYLCDSKTLIKEMLGDIYGKNETIQEKIYRINGIIGASLSHREGMSVEQIYDLLQKKLRRIDLRDFVFHRQFNEFVYAKALEKANRE